MTQRIINELSSRVDRSPRRWATFLLAHGIAALWLGTILSLGAATSRAAEPATPDTAPDAATDELPPIRSARDLFQLYGADEERLQSIVDGTDVDNDELITLIRALKAAERFTVGQLFQYRQTQLPWTAWTERPASVRGELYELRGTAVRVERREVPEAQAERYQLTHYYRCELVLDESREPAIVYTLAVPRAWKDGVLDERAGARGLFFKLAGRAPEAIRPVFVSTRVAWYPHTPLGDLGMDVGLLDTVRNPRYERAQPKAPPKLVEASPLKAEERDAFYELLAAVGRANPAELARATHDPSLAQDRYPIEPLFNRPDTQRGQLLALTGTAERVVEIRVESPELIAMYGFDHYYELEVVTSASQGNPLTFIVRELPAGLKQGEQVQVDVRIPGFFFKVWTYPLQVRGKQLVQAAPLIIGRIPTLVPRPKADSSFSTTIIALLLLSLLLMLVGVWWFGRSDRRFQRDVLQPKVHAPNSASFDHLRQLDSGPTNIAGRE